MLSAYGKIGMHIDRSCFLLQYIFLTDIQELLKSCYIYKCTILSSVFNIKVHAIPNTITTLNNKTGTEKEKVTT